MSKTPVLDHAGHCTATVAALTPAALLPGALTFAWAGFCLGAYREFSQHLTKFTLAGAKQVLLSRGSQIDILDHMFVGFVVGFLV